MGRKKQYSLQCRMMGVIWGGIVWLRCRGMGSFGLVRRLRENLVSREGGFGIRFVGGGRRLRRRFVKGRRGCEGWKVVWVAWGGAG